VGRYSVEPGKKPPFEERLFCVGGFTQAIRYVLSPLSLLTDSTVNSIFLVKVPLMKPRMLWFCQLVALASSAIVAPSFLRRSSRTRSFLLSFGLTDRSFAVFVNANGFQPTDVFEADVRSKELVTSSLIRRLEGFALTEYQDCFDWRGHRSKTRL